jgi:hypothetical protein
MGNSDFPIINSVFQISPDPQLEHKKINRFNKKHLKAIMYWNKRSLNLTMHTINWVLIVGSEEVFFKKFVYKKEDLLLKLTTLYYDENDGSTTILKITSHEKVSDIPPRFLIEGYILVYNSNKQEEMKRFFTLIITSDKTISVAYNYRMTQPDGKVRHYLFLKYYDNPTSIYTYVLNSGDD